MKAPSTRTVTDTEAAWIILQDPERYAGLPVMWAELWVERHGPARQPVAKAERTMEDRLAAHEERQRKKKIARQRERWSQREWADFAEGKPLHQRPRILHCRLRSQRTVVDRH
jgi:hypothetical protein